jgi:hypothetical protein
LNDARRDVDPVRAVFENGADLPPLGPWVQHAACRGMGEVFTERPDGLEDLAMIERVCRRRPLRAEGALLGAQEAVHGVYAGTWHTYKAGRELELQAAS